MEIDEALRLSDPAAATEMPRPESLLGARIKEQALGDAMSASDPRLSSDRSRSLFVPIAALVAVAATVVLVVVLLPPQLGPSGSEAAAAFENLAQTASKQSTLGPGEFAYTEVESEPTGVTAAGAAGSAKSWTQFSVGTVQTWIAADGSGRQVTTTDLNPHFMTSADESAWKASGGTFDEPPSYVVDVEQFGPGGKGLSTNQFPESRSLPYDVSALPTNPNRLARTLCTTKAWRNITTSSDFGPSYSFQKNPGCSLFGIAATLLQGPDVGSSPALRQALYKVLAAVPGVQLIGNRTDASGRRGVELRLIERRPAGVTKVTCTNADTTPRVTKTLSFHYGASATIYTVIIDSKSATLLSVERSFSPSKVPSSSLLPCGGAPNLPKETTELIPDRSVLLTSGVVDSTQAVARGSVENCAPGSVPVAPWNICQGTRVDGDH